MSIRLAIAGAAGRMGLRLVALAAADGRFRVTAALEASGSGALGRDAGTLAGIGAINVAVSEQAVEDFDVLIDFTTATATGGWLALCQSCRRAMVIGTTGHDAAQLAAIGDAAHSIPILRAANMSVGVNVLLGAVQQLSRELGPEYDVEIIETHHRFKTDAPSGTALAFKDAVLAGRNDHNARLVHGRQGATGARTTGEIGMHAVRAGDVVGEHEVRFTTLGESVAVRHVAHSRDTFARGALRAAAWLASRPAGLYTMVDVLAPSAVP